MEVGLYFIKFALYIINSKSSKEKIQHQVGNLVYNLHYIKL